MDFLNGAGNAVTGALAGNGEWLSFGIGIVAMWYIANRFKWTFWQTILIMGVTTIIWTVLGGNWPPSLIGVSTVLQNGATASSQAGDSFGPALTSLLGGNLLGRAITATAAFIVAVIVVQVLVSKPKR